MADDIIDYEGFENYGPPLPRNFAYAGWNQNDTMNVYDGSSYSNLMHQGLQASGWKPQLGNVNGLMGFINGLSGSGSAFFIFTSSITTGRLALSRTLPASYSRIILGFAFMTDMGAESGMQFKDNAGMQATLTVDKLGRINLYRGDYGGTALYTSSSLITPNTRNYIEIDIKFNNGAGTYQIWLNGTSLTSASSQNTTGSTSSTVTRITLGNNIENLVKFAFDDMYWRDNTTGTATPFGDCTVESIKPNSDSSVAFSTAASGVGPYYCLTLAALTAAILANVLYVLPITPTVNMTINSLGTWVTATALTAKLKGVIYSDNAGSPGSLLSSGTEITNIIKGQILTLPLVTPQSLIAGTQYWIGMFTDSSISFERADAYFNGQTKSNTYTLGAPAGPLSGMSTLSATACLWANCTNSAGNYAQINNTTPQIVLNTSIGYNQSSNVSDEDLFGCGSLSASPTSVYSVKVSAIAAKSASGSRTMDIRLKSNLTTSSGSASGFILPTFTPNGFSSRYDKDPNGNITWTGSAVNAMKIGYKVAS